jgi:hypothetical protein
VIETVNLEGFVYSGGTISSICRSDVLRFFVEGRLAI